MSHIYELAISVQDGDFTAWVIHDGHAYPFEDATKAASAVYVEGIEKYDDDAVFIDAVLSEDVWWDTDDDKLTEFVEQIKEAADGPEPLPECEHELRTFATKPPHTKCVRCGKRVATNA